MDVHGLVHRADGRPNGGIHTDVYIGPADVSFANMEILELEIGAAYPTAAGRLERQGIIRTRTTAR